MSPVIKIIVGLVIALVAYAVITLALPGDTGASGAGGINIGLLFVLVAATVSTAFIVRDASPAAPLSNEKTPRTNPGITDPARESGQVKWFNVSKGFGFITKDDGEEIFVHFRSIRGEGRRSLRDGQRVSFVVADSEKGPQAEDVTPAPG